MQKMPTKASRSALVIEVLLDRSHPPKWVQIVTSRPGTEGTFTRTWPIAEHGFDQDVLEDLGVTVQGWLIGLAVLSTGGVQARLV